MKQTNTTYKQGAVEVQVIIYHGKTLEEIAQGNVDKLNSRKERNVLDGRNASVLQYCMAVGNNIIAHGDMSGIRLREFTMKSKVSELDEYAEAIYNWLV